MEFGCPSAEKSWRNVEHNLVSTLFRRHNDLFERRRVDFFVEMSARSRIEFLFWFTTFSDRSLFEIVKLIMNAHISARQLQLLLAEKYFAPEIVGRRMFGVLITIFGKLKGLKLKEDRWMKQLLILISQIPTEAEREPWFALLESTNASQITKALSGNYLDETLEYVQEINLDLLLLYHNFILKTVLSSSLHFHHELIVFKQLGLKNKTTFMFLE